MHSTKKDFCPWQARVSVVSTTHSAASRRRRSGSLSGCPMGVEAISSMNAEFFSSLEEAADAAASSTPMARRMVGRGARGLNPADPAAHGGG